MRRRATFIGSAVAALVVIAFGATALMMRGGHLRPVSPGLQSIVKVVCPGRSYFGSAYGLPVIRPRNDCTPSFTVQDVRDYLNHNAASLGRIEVVGKPTVNIVLFTTIQDLGRASGDSEFAANYPADMVICYVELSGMIRPVGGPFIPGTPRATASDQPSMGTAYFILDAHTGNELAAGTPAPVK